MLVLSVVQCTEQNKDTQKALVGPTYLLQQHFDCVYVVLKVLCNGIVFLNYNVLYTNFTFNVTRENGLSQILF